MPKGSLVPKAGWASWLLVTTLLTALLLVACGDNTATPASGSATTTVAVTSASATNGAVSTTTAAQTATTASSAATTAVASATTTQAASATTAAAQLAPVELTYTYPAFSPIPKDLQVVQDALNVILKQKINATIKLNAIDGSAYDQKMKLATAAGEKMDVVFTAPWINSYYQNVANGGLLPLDDLLPKYAPALYATMPPATWNAAKVNGKIYGVINQQIFVKPWGVYVRKDLADKYKLDLSTISKYEDLEPFLTQIKQNETGVTPVYTDDSSSTSFYQAEQFGFDPIVDQSVQADVKFDDQGLKAFNAYETPEFKQSITLARKWYQAGFVTKDPAPASDATGAFKAGKYAVIVGTVVKPGGEFELKSKYGFDFVSKAIAKPILTTAGTVATLNGISKTSANPERAMMFLNLLNTDKQVYNLLAKGIEGKHYVKVTDNVIGLPSGVTAETNAYNPNTDWMFGNQFNAYYADKAQVGSWEATYKLNQEATPSVALGFAFDNTKVKSEIAQVSAVVKQYGNPLIGGLVDSNTVLPEFLNRLKQAGYDRILTEVQSQLDTWKKSK